MELILYVLVDPNGEFTPIMMSREMVRARVNSDLDASSIDQCMVNYTLNSYHVNDIKLVRLDNDEGFTLVDPNFPPEHRMHVIEPQVVMPEKDIYDRLSYYYLNEMVWRALHNHVY